MARFWILLLLLWYRAITMVRTEEDNPAPQSIDFDRPESKNEDKDDENPLEKSPENHEEATNDNDLMNYRSLDDDQFKQREEIANFPTYAFNIYKRNFHSWGGKRGLSEDKREQRDATRPKKPAFHSWGGKRSPMDDYYGFDKREYKKMPFSSWGGKRTYDEGSESIMNEYPDFAMPRDTGVMMGRRRLKFNSWGGKRSMDGPFNPDIKRKFSPWGGKRSFEEPIDEAQLYEAIKRTFSSWGGK